MTVREQGCRLQGGRNGAVNGMKRHDSMWTEVDVWCTQELPMHHPNDKHNTK